MVSDKYRSIILLLIVLFATVALVFFYNTKEDSGDYLYIEDDILYITIEKAIEDYNYLFEIIMEDCPLVIVSQRKYNTDFDSTYKKYFELINRYEKSIPVNLLSTYMNLCLGDMRIPHLNIIAFRQYEYYLGIYEKNENDYIYNKLISDPTKFTYEYYSKAFKTDGESVSDKLDLHFLSTQYQKIDDLMYVKIDSFSYDLDGELIVLEEAFSNLEDIATIVIDVSNNSGGSDSIWKEHILDYLTDKELSMLNYSFYKSSPRVERYLSSIYLETTRDFGFLDSFDNVNLSDIQLMDTASEIITLFYPDKENIFDGSIYIVVSERTASSAEKFAQFCQANGIATLVGSRTNGSGVGMNPNIEYLPNSGILMRYPINYSLNNDGSCHDEFGILPDIEYYGDNVVEMITSSLLHK